jgi:hypothetical protein
MTDESPQLPTWRRRIAATAEVVKDLRVIGGAVLAFAIGAVTFFGVNPLSGSEASTSARLEVSPKPAHQNMALGLYYEELLSSNPPAHLDEAELATTGDVYTVSVVGADGVDECHVTVSLLTGSRSLLPYPAELPRKRACPEKRENDRFELQVWVPTLDCIHSYIARVTLNDDSGPLGSGESKPVVLAGPEQGQCE